MDITYDYEELIAEIQADISEGLLDDTIYIVREKHPDTDLYMPITDYYYNFTDVPVGEKVIKTNPKEVLEEMRTMSEMFADKSK